jgi:hypothetical protein
MDDTVDAVERTRDDIAVANVAADELGFGRQIDRPLLVAMDLFDETIENANVVAAMKKLPGDSSSDKPGTAGDQNCLSQC